MFFISRQKPFLFSKYLSFCLDFLVMYQNSLIRKISLISNFITSQPGWQTIVIHILPNILRTKGNHNKIWSVNRMLHEKHFFLRNYTQNVMEKLVPDPFLENKNWAYTVCFYCMPSRGLSKYMETKMQGTCFYLILSFF